MIQSASPLKTRKHAKGTGLPPAVASGERLGRHGPELPVPWPSVVRPCCPLHAPIPEILGHSQISITMDVYTHVVQDTEREAMSPMDRLLRKRRP